MGNAFFNYDKEEDILFIYKKEKVKGSVEIGDNYALHFNYQNQFVGIDIFKASKLFGIPKSTLSKIKNASLNTKIAGNVVLLMYAFVFVYKKIEKSVQHVVNVEFKDESKIPIKAMI